jgi:hypothetical protein
MIVDVVLFVDLYFVPILKEREVVIQHKRCNYINIAKLSLHADDIRCGKQFERMGIV